MTFEGYAKIYDCIRDSALSQPESGAPVAALMRDERWACVLGENGPAGIAMYTEGSSVPPVLDAVVSGDGGQCSVTSLGQLASAGMSWNFEEASFAAAAANACLNTKERIAALGCGIPRELHYSFGMDFRDRTVAIVGHLKNAPRYARDAKRIYILERNPREGDYPDSACDYIIPQCDIVIITGSSLINKTLPHLLSLCGDAYTVLTGPSVPLCPALKDFGIDRLAGFAVTDTNGITEAIRLDNLHSPYVFGESFVI